MEAYGKALATIADVDDDDLIYGPNGGFTAVLSTPSVDRDGDSLLRDEWIDLPEHCTLDMDHGMTVATTIGSFTPYWGDDGALMMRAAFSSIPRAQEARTLVKEKHVRDVSVAFMTDKTKKSGEPRRELLNAGIVGIGSNREAKILDSKALDVRAEEIAETPAEVRTKQIADMWEALGVKAPEPYGHVTYADPQEGKYPIDTVAHIRAALSYINVQHNYDALGDHAPHVKRAIEAAARAHGIHVSGTAAFEDGETKSITMHPHDFGLVLSLMTEVATKAPMGTGDNPALTQAIHDASVHLGAACYPLTPEDTDPSGSEEGANRSIDAVETEETPEAETKEAFDPDDPTTYEVIETEEIPDDSPLGRWLSSFEKRLAETLIGSKSPVDESPAEAAAASDEEPAPADTKAAAEDAAEISPMLQTEIMRMRLALFDN
jgi:hypothetical protein